MSIKILDYFVQQRVLEHCHDPKTQSIVMDEILKSIIMLAQDQYGNYVVQVWSNKEKLKRKGGQMTQVTEVYFLTLKIFLIILLRKSKYY